MFLALNLGLQTMPPIVRKGRGDKRQFSLLSFSLRNGEVPLIDGICGRLPLAALHSCAERSAWPAFHLGFTALEQDELQEHIDRSAEAHDLVAVRWGEEEEALR